MAVIKPKTCRICKRLIYIDKEVGWCQPMSGWYYHETCYEDFAKKKKALKDSIASNEVQDDLYFEGTYDYLQKELKIGLNFVKFHNQWENFLKKGFTAKGIYFTLRYFYDIQKGDKEKSEGGIGIVPYIYTEATQYWGERNQREKGICNKIEEQMKKSFAQSVRPIFQKFKPKQKPINDLASIALTEDEED